MPCFFVISLLIATGTPLRVVAAITGQIAGTIVDGGGKPVANAAVTARAESGTYRATSDRDGHFTMIGVVPDTYVVSIEKTGFEAQYVSGVTVAADTTASVNVTFSKALRTIVRLRSRSSSSAFQVNQTEDSYSFNGEALTTLLGKQFNTDQKSLLTSLPAVTVDNKGGIFIRGGFSFQVAYQYEGIDYTEPTRSLQDQFSNVGNFDQLSGIGSVQIIPGGGDATHGNTGTGLVSFQAKRGSYPGHGTLDFEAGTFPFDHQFGIEYGYATPSNHFSNYFTFTGARRDFQYGPQGAHAAQLGYNFGFDPTTVPGYTTDPYRTILDSTQSIYDAASTQSSNTLLDNAIVKFGKDSKQSLQFFIQNQVVQQQLSYGGYGNNVYFSGSPAAAILFGQELPLLYQSVEPFYPTQSAVLQYTGTPDKITSPFTAYKVEYSNSIGASTFLTARYYRTFNQSSEDEPALGVYVPSSGGTRTAVALEASRQVGSKNFLEVGGKYEFVEPFGSKEYVGQFDGNGLPVYFGFVPLAADFANPGLTYTQLVNGVPTITAIPTGYLHRFFPKGTPRLPPAILEATTNQQDYALFGQDTVSVGERFRATLGIRLDGYNFLTPNDPANPPQTSGLAHQRLYEPHVGLSEKLTKVDSLRFTYGRTLSIPLPSLVSFQLSRAPYAPYARIPTNGPVDTCGPAGNARCANYGDLLYWTQRNFLYPPGTVRFTTPLRGASYTNYDFSYAHDFGHGYSAKVTPFFRRGYDIIEASQNVLGYGEFLHLPILGIAGYTNQGLQKATGVEFLATHDAIYGLSGSISATYLNQLGNDVPGASLTQTALALGDLFHSPNFSPVQVTLATTYRSHGGFRINPVVHIESGYPIGIGAFSTGVIAGKYYNLPATDAFFGYGNAYYYTDPENPGTFFNPVISATRGTNEGSAAGSLTSSPRVNTDVTFEFSAPGRSSTFGIAVSNLFDQVYGIPLQNPNYRNVLSTGYTGPGNNGQFYDSNNVQVKVNGSPFVGTDATAPYLVFPSRPPRAVRFYYQVGL